MAITGIGGGENVRIFDEERTSTGDNDTEGASLHMIRAVGEEDLVFSFAR
jgi:hypothetical protein